MLRRHRPTIVLRVLVTPALCLALAVALPCAAYSAAPDSTNPGSAEANESPATPQPDSLKAQTLAAVDQASQYLRGQSLNIGGGYTFDKFSFYKLKGVPKENLGSTALVDMTDNGGIAPFVEYASAERPIAKIPMASGALSLGYNFIATYSTFNVNRELVDNPFNGENFGTHVTGDFALAGGLLFARLGPLFPGSELYWSGGLGAGAALMRYSGTVLVRQGVHFGELHSVSGGADNVRTFGTLNWELQFGRWLVAFRSLAIQTGSSSELAGLERNSQYLAYNFRF